MKRTVLAFDGVAPDEVTEELLVELLDVSEEHGLDIEGVGIDRQRSSEGR